MKNQQIIQKTLTERIVDTRTYRYMAKEFADHTEIIRLPLAALNTTAAINGWEKVAEIR
jgi:hypothetical protein